MGSRRGRAGGISVTRLRRWLLVGVIVLLTALVGLLGIARWKARRFLHDLPAKLGIDIKSQANGFTYSQSVKGHTLFTLHAAKAIQRQNGKTTLHDVAITLYGPEGSHETDSIRGAEFEYDQNNGIVKAMGEVHLDLASPSSAQQNPSAKRIAVTTSGLVFMQKQGIATTDQPLHIEYGDLHGTATGADYTTATGLLNLHSAVIMDGTQDRQPVHLTAASAQLDRNQRLATLHTAFVRTGEMKAQGDTVVLDAGPSGGIDEIRADGHTSLQSGDGIRAQAPKLVAKISEQNKPTLATMSGGVILSHPDGSGSGQTAVVHFDGLGNATTAELTGGVTFDHHSATSLDHLTAANLVAALAQDATRHTILKDATATGRAQLRSVTTGKPAKTTVISGDTLHAIMAASGRKHYVSLLTGNGSTRLDEDDGAGTTRTSTGDTLQIKLLPPGATKAASTVQSAMQDGHVTVMAKSPAKSGKTASETHATASHADFEGSTGKLLLTGAPSVTGDGMQIAADRITLTQGNGDADATGSVRGVYQSQKDSDPVHVTAEHATVAGSVAKFFAGANAARMWTSSSQMEAPVIEVDRNTNRLMAHAPSGSAATGTVHLLLPASATGKQKNSGVVRIVGTTLLYVPVEGTRPAHADVTGGVRMDTSGASLTARQAVATLSGSTPGVLSGSVQQIVASGAVNIAQPGRTGQGERLVYTSADERYVLTGTPQSQPKVIDTQKGTITGATLILHGADNNVEVEGTGTHRVHTEVEANPQKR
ncbi:LPS export ABC transporter periplasmic protein LptC [Terriglobus sp. RCC_193]|uniref:LPS export ABC transporter periplasmic protein LptC n=1 Tax=Terriglobus sp. RCC_193 TaxID=3239218 RepID=UPI003524395D